MRHVRNAIFNVFGLGDIRSDTAEAVETALLDHRLSRHGPPAEFARAVFDRCNQVLERHLPFKRRLQRFARITRMEGIKEWLAATEYVMGAPLCLGSVAHDRQVLQNARSIRQPERVGRAFFKIPQQKPDNLCLLLYRRPAEILFDKLAVGPRHSHEKDHKIVDHQDREDRIVWACLKHKRGRKAKPCRNDIVDGRCGNTRQQEPAGEHHAGRDDAHHHLALHIGSAQNNDGRQPP